jgi:hypothetical protein
MLVAPQIMQDTSDANEHLVQVSRISGLRFAFVSRLAKSAPNFPACEPNALVGHYNATLGEDLLGFAEAETEHVI